VPSLRGDAGRGYVKVGRDPLEFQTALAPGPLPGQGRRPTRPTRSGVWAQPCTRGCRPAWQDAKLPFRIEALPKTSDYRQVLSGLLKLPGNGAFVGGLERGDAPQWQASTAAATADWLQFVLGITAGNRPRTLNLEAKRDGVHGLIAGGTGSGKSELLMTMIVGMVVNYSTRRSSTLVLVDYKGGGAFKPFEGLPHVRRHRDQPQQGGRASHVQRHRRRDAPPPAAQRRHQHQGHHRLSPARAAPHP
jgi:S-DNA-T family DNA segregation ATPase FtsK/SpoIIIE